MDYKALSAAIIKKCNDESNCLTKAVQIFARFFVYSLENFAFILSFISGMQNDYFFLMENNDAYSFLRWDRVTIQPIQQR